MLSLLRQICANEKRLVLSLFVISFLFRIVYAVIFYNTYGESRFSDDLDYISYADQIHKQGILVLNIDAIRDNGHQVGIGWPLILSAIFGFFGKVYPIIFFLNAIFGALHVVLIFKIGKHIFNAYVGLMAGAISAIYIRFIKFTPTILKENLIHVCFALLIFLFLKHLKSRNYKSMGLFAVFYLIFLHIDERYLALLPVFVLIILFTKRNDFRINLRHVLFFGLIFIVGLTPWTIRNNMVYKRPILLGFQTSSFTDFLFTKKSDQFVNGKSGSQDSYTKKNLIVYENIVQDIQGGKSLKPYDDFKYVKLIQQGIKEGHIPHTYGYWESKRYEFSEFFRICRFEGNYVGNGYRYMPAWPVINNIVYIGFYGIPLLLCVFGIIHAKLWKSMPSSALILIMVSYSLVHIFLIHSLDRYRIPIDGFIFIFASYTVFLQLKNRQIKRQH